MAGSGAGVVIAFFLGLFVLAAATTGPDGERKPLFSLREQEERQERSRPPSLHSGAQEVPTEEEPSLSKEEVERELDRAYRELEELEEEVRIAKIWGERSPHEGSVTLDRRNVRTEDSDEEYLVLNASRNNEKPINITWWRIESYVTDLGRWIEPGVRIYQSGRVNEGRPIWIEPGERANIISGESPVGISFHENICTGYLEERQDFTPSLRRSCPHPEKELRESFVQLDDDICHEFIEDLGTCEIPESSAVENAGLSAQCEDLIFRNFNYKQCVDEHRFRPFFDEGEWYIYLKRDDDLWREEREIIRLLDENNKTVDVIEY